MKPRILVTGATGFIGRYVVARLAEEGFPQTCLSRSGQEFSYAQCRSLRCNLADKSSVQHHRRALRSSPLVVHLAANIPQGNRPDSDVGSIFHGGLALTTNLFEEINPEYVVCGSTIDVYGHIQKVPISEDHPVSPVTNYAAAKAATEAYLSAYAASHDIPIAFLRFSQVYGPGDSSLKVIPRTIDAVFRGQRPVVFGQGRDTRDYLFVEDAAAAVVRAVIRRAGGVYNIGSGKAISVHRAVGAVIQASERKVQPIMRAAQKTTSRMYYDISRAEKKLGYTPQTTFRVGIRRTTRAARPLLVFDLDGTLIDPELRYYTLYRDLMGARPVISQRDYWSYRRQALSELDIVRKTVSDREFLATYGKQWMKRIEQWQYLKLDTVLPHVRSVLRKLSASYGLILVTHRRKYKNLRRQLSQLGLEPFLDTVISTESKGDASTIQRDTEQIRDVAGRLIGVIGDTSADISVARKLEVAAIAVLTGMRNEDILKQSRPSFIVPDLREVPRCLADLSK